MANVAHCLAADRWRDSLIFDLSRLPTADNWALQGALADFLCPPLANLVHPHELVVSAPYLLFQVFKVLAGVCRNSCNH